MFEAESFNSQRAISEVMNKKTLKVSTKEEMAITALRKNRKNMKSQV